MKRLFPLIAILCLFILWGCPKEEPEQPVLTPIQTSYEIGYQGGSVSISFKTNQTYSAKSDATSWLTVSQPTKVVNTESIKVTASENTSESPRTGNITVTAGTLSATFTVTQAGKPKDPDPEPPVPEDPDKLENAGLMSTFTVPDTGGDITVKVRSNVDYTVNCTADWITRTKAGSVHVDELVFHVAANTGAARSATISFTYGTELTFSVTVNQAEYVPPGEDPFIEISNTDLSVGGAGGEVTLTVNANYPYTVDADVQWVTVIDAGETCVLKFDYNPGEDSRMTQLMFSCEGLIEFVNVTQAGSDSNADPFDIGSDLSARGHANCYIVTKAGNYTFDVSVMGNGPQGFLWEADEAEAQNLWPTWDFDVSFTNYGKDGPSQTKVLWDDGGVLTNVSIKDLIVSFTATGAKGNALIAVYDRSNNLLWSWHIWCTDSPKRLKHETFDGTQIVMLDRNLGATSCNPSDGAATYGYWYQFGRKDPLKLYPNVAWDMIAGQQSMQHSVEHPTAIYQITGKTTEWFNGSVSTITADLWGNPYAMHNGADHVYQASMSELRKTIYDPCPPGYMVPPEWAWETFTMNDCEVSDYGLTFAEENGYSFYPFAGFGDSGDAYGGDSGWYGYPGFTPNSDGSKWHHNMRNVVACWSSSSAYHFDPQWNAENYQHAKMFYYRQDEEARDNLVMVNKDSPATLYSNPIYSHIRERCCSVRCMRMQ